MKVDELKLNPRRVHMASQDVAHYHVDWPYVKPLLHLYQSRRGTVVLLRELVQGDSSDLP